MSEKIDNLFPIDEAIRLSRAWLKEHGRRVTTEDITNAIAFAVVLVGDTFEDWDSSTDEEKEDQAVTLGALMIARNLLQEMLKEDE